MVEAGRRVGAARGHDSCPRRTTSPRRCSSSPRQVEHFPRHLGIHSGGMVICDRPVDRGVPGRVGTHGRPQRAAVGQGRLRRGRPREVRPARPRDAVARCTTRSTSSAEHRGVRGRPRHHPAGRRGLRHVVPRRLGRRVPGREPGADGDAAAAQARARSTTSSSRSRSSARVRSRAGRCTPTSGAATAPSR